MPEQIIIKIERPDVGIEYQPATPEAEIRDRLAASELSLHALAQHVRDLRAMLGLLCPTVVLDLAQSDSWIDGM